jgi:catechol 2,3-dioxygenase-like lactoylglutathione lyase family enzyme
MRVTQIIADLHVSDLKAAQTFYTDYLGLTEGTFSRRRGQPPVDDPPRHRA